MTTIHYRTADVEGLKVFYREAGRPDAPMLLLLTMDTSFDGGVAPSDGAAAG